ncbi:condensation domain-containing protein [Streptomyces fumanus]|uniref:Condensation domain-containing protein n=1 Tax=Streptomyces fumanus TaxID=67302 RepID=A0A919ADZ2_9ACTN|nr:condensation domain-containing protein [Streptomyces fumanus]GHE97478.1 hypothetical protein GCM10018772_22130 [Streptomyces fumanus]
MSEPAVHAATYAQELLGLVESMLPGTVMNPRFTVRAAYRLPAGTDVAVLRAALDDVVARHGALRTRLVRDGDGLRQEVLAPMPARLDVTRLPAGEPVREWIAAAAVRPRPPHEPPLLWAELCLPDDGGDPVLVLVGHHIAVDGWSQDVLARDLADAYAARLDGRVLGDPPLQYTDIAAQDRGGAWQERIRQVLPYWRERLTGIAGLGLPCETPGAEPGPPAVHRFTLAPDLALAVRQSARRARSTPFALLMTAFVRGVLPPGDTLVPVITAGRIPSEWDTVGFLLNVLPIRVDDTGQDLDALRGHIDGRCREAYAHDIPWVPVLGAAPEMPARLTDRARVPPVFQMIPRPPLAPPREPGARPLVALPDQSLPPQVIPVPFAWTVRWDTTPQVYVTYDSHLFGPRWMRAAEAGFLTALTRLAGR